MESAIKLAPKMCLSDGQWVFVRDRDGILDEGWVGIICDEEMLSEQMRKTRPPRSSIYAGNNHLREYEYPVWFPGKDLSYVDPMLNQSTSYVEGFADLRETYLQLVDQRHEAFRA